MSDAPTAFTPLFNRLLTGQPFGKDDVRAAFDAILAGAWSTTQVAGFAVALRMRGDSADALLAAAEAMRAAMTAVDHGMPLVLDTCGTGGDGSRTLNISTGSAILLAALGVPVAKHGNRSVSSQCGSADVVEALGIPLDIAPTRQASVLRDTGIAFLFAPAHHPALRHAAQARRELGVRTIFNALGPLANPARASHQLLGVYDDALRPLAAEVLGRLGVRRAWVLRSVDGLDEMSPASETRISELREDGTVHERVLSPEDFGLSRFPLAALAGGDAKANAVALEAILAGEAHPAADAIVLNAAAALAVATGDAPRVCGERAREALRAGHAMKTLEAWRAAARREREAA